MEIEIADISDKIETTKVVLNEKDIEKSFSKQLNVTEWDNNWVLIEGHTYLLKVYLFDKDRHLIRLGENTIFKYDLLAKHFKLIKENIISSELIV